MGVFQPSTSEIRPPFPHVVGPSADFGEKGVPMFALSLIDTLRLAFGQVVYHHKSHAQVAASLTRWSRWLRAVQTLLMLAVVFTSVAAAFGKGQQYAVASAVLASLALLIFILHVLFDFETAARAHHAWHTRLWHVREQYRALLSDLNDGAINADAARAKRNALMEEVNAIHAVAPSLTRRVFTATRTAARDDEETALADEEIDRFLPKSLHGTEKPAAVPAGT